MPHYFVSEETLCQHFREHRQGTYNTQNNRRLYCNICCPTLAESNYASGFPVFWDWIRTSHFAQYYNGYTILAFNDLEQSINRGDSILSKQLLASITFQALTSNRDKLVFLIQRLFVVTNQFSTTPTSQQITEARRLYRAPRPNLPVTRPI